MVFALPLFAFGQTSAVSTTPDERLKEVFTKEEISFWEANNTFIIQRYNFYLDNAWAIVDVPAEKLVGADYKEVVISDLQKVNILMVEKENDIKRHFDKSMTYRIKGQDKLLMYLSEKEFTKRLNKALGRS